MRLPKPIKQVRNFSDLFIPKEHRLSELDMNRNFWNDLTRLNDAFPNCTIYLTYFLIRFDEHYYGIDLKLKSNNKDLNQRLQNLYDRLYYKGNFRIPDLYRDYFLGHSKPV